MSIILPYYEQDDYPEYEYNGEIHKYHPDFVVNGEIIEIKNYLDL